MRIVMADHLEVAFECRVVSWVKSNDCWIPLVVSLVLMLLSYSQPDISLCQVLAEDERTFTRLECPLHSVETLKELSHILVIGVL